MLHPILEIIMIIGFSLFYCLLIMAELIYLSHKTSRFKSYDIMQLPGNKNIKADIELVKKLVSQGVGYISMPDVMKTFYSHYPFWIISVRMIFAIALLWLHPAGYWILPIVIVLLLEYVAVAFRRKTARKFSYKIFTELIPEISRSQEDRINNAVRKYGREVSSEMRKMLTDFLHNDADKILKRFEKTLNGNLEELNATILSVSTILDTDTEQLIDTLTYLKNELDKTVSTLDSQFTIANENMRDSSDSLAVVLKTFSESVGQLDNTLDGLVEKVQKLYEFYAIGNESLGKPFEEFGETVGLYLSEVKRLAENASDILVRSNNIYSAIDEFRSTLAQTSEQFAKGAEPTAELTRVIAETNSNLIIFLDQKFLPIMNELNKKIDKFTQESSKRRSIFG